MKECSFCDRLLPVSAFSWADKERTRHRGDCRDCCGVKRRKRLQDPKLYAKHRINHRYAIIKHKYGLSRDEADQLLTRQQYQCAICLIPVDLGSNFDHCHITGKVRGILCWNCNIAIGRLKDDPVLVQRALNYLRGDSD